MLSATLPMNGGGRFFRRRSISSDEIVSWEKNLYMRNYFQIAHNKRENPKLIEITSKILKDRVEVELFVVGVRRVLVEICSRPHNLIEIFSAICESI